MRCLLDKVTARYAVQGLLKLAEGRNLTTEELLTLDFFSRATPPTTHLFIVPQTAHVLQLFARLPRYSAIIQLFLNRVDSALPARYFKRWARRLRRHNFAREDAAILALATFGTDKTAAVLGMHVVVTFDQPLIHHWSIQHVAIQKRLAAMQGAIPAPYCQRLYLKFYVLNRSVCHLLKRSSNILCVIEGAPSAWFPRILDLPPVGA